MKNQMKNWQRGIRATAEKNRTALSRDIIDLGVCLKEVVSNKYTQIELNKKCENELTKLKSELGESNISHEGTLAALRSKHNNTMIKIRLEWKEIFRKLGLGSKKPCVTEQT